MSEAAPVDVITGGENDDAAAAAAAAAAAGGGGGEPTWRDTLPDELKADATLAKYGTLEDFARGHLETKKALGADKIVLPKGDDDQDGWNGLYAAIGRPEKPDDYQFPSLKDGEKSELADAFRPVAHQLGMSQKMAEGVDAFIGEFTAKASGAALAAASIAMDGLATEKGVTREQLDTKISDICTKTGMDAEAAAGLVKAAGGNEAAARWLLALGDKIGEGKFVDGDPQDFGLGGRDPTELRDELTNSKDFRAKLDANDPEALARWKNVQAAVAAQRGAKAA